jgi:hypothetical protein
MALVNTVNNLVVYWISIILTFTDFTELIVCNIFHYNFINSKFSIKSGIKILHVRRVIKMYVYETCSRVWVGKHLSHKYTINSGLKEGDAFSILLFNFAL